MKKYRFKIVKSLFFKDLREEVKSEKALVVLRLKHLGVQRNEERRSIERGGEEDLKIVKITAKL